MKSLWDENEAARLVKAAGNDPAEQDLAMRVYTSQLIGQEADLVLHGGGNTSVKTRRLDEAGVERDVVHVKGSGWDLATIEGAGLPAMWLEPLLEARKTATMSDEEMVSFLRGQMLDQSGPNPSVEALLHAFLPAKFVDHTHSSAGLALANQPNAADIAREIFGDELCIVPYVMPGFKLSHAADQIFAKEGAGTSGQFLVNHGFFSIGDDARTAYERIVRYTTMSEEYLAAKGAALMPEEPDTKQDNPEAHDVIAALRTVLEEWEFFADNLVLDLRCGDANNKFLALDGLAEITGRGTATPDHVIRIKPRPVLGEASYNVDDWRTQIQSFATWYKEYFDRNAPHAEEPKTMLDPLPRVALIRGLGIVGIGRSAKEAGVAADLAEQTARIILSAEGIGRFTPLNERDLFDMEYWSLEQAKLK
jgi:rhamnose utilization protein RhaD (predicted bifunctional aldolase and dehydrogenase)